MNAELPVTVLSGFLGSGKTTLLTHLLKHCQDKKIALIVNDMSELNVDAELVKDLRLEKTEAKLVEMSNGCICCTLREDLWEQVGKLAEEKAYDYLIIESTGVSEPLPVAATFSFVDETGFSLSKVARLDTMVTVVDCLNFFQNYYSSEDLSEERSLVDLLVDQVEFADVILLNKTDLVGEAELHDIRHLLGKLNPRAELVECRFSEVDPKKVLDTGKYDPEQAEGPEWIRELTSLTPVDHVSETAEYGISSFVYRAGRPFHPERLWQVVQESMEGILRIKGFFWLASQPEFMGYWSQAGSSLRLENKGRWADPCQQLVVIGLDLNASQVTRALDYCLLTDQEWAAGPTGWKELPDPFPSW